MQKAIWYVAFVEVNCPAPLSSLTRPIVVPQTPHQKKKIPLQEVKTVVDSFKAFLSSRDIKIGGSVLWSCLDDEVDDGILRQHYGCKKVSENSTVLRILRQRKNLLQSLQHIIQHSSNQESLLLPGIARVFRMTIFLTPRLSDTRKVRAFMMLKLIMHY